MFPCGEAHATMKYVEILSRSHRGKQQACALGFAVFYRIEGSAELRLSGANTKLKT
jgi:hypothetical protein